jgi:hypothetical protein
MEGTDPPTLPPQMFTTSAQLLDLTDSTFYSALFDRFSDIRECANAALTTLLLLLLHPYERRTDTIREIDDCFKGW